MRASGVEAGEGFNQGSEVFIFSLEAGLFLFLLLLLSRIAVKEAILILIQCCFSTE